MSFIFPPLCIGSLHFYLKQFTSTFLFTKTSVKLYQSLKASTVIAGRNFPLHPYLSWAFNRLIGSLTEPNRRALTRTYVWEGVVRLALFSASRFTVHRLSLNKSFAGDVELAMKAQLRDGLVLLLL